MLSSAVAEGEFSEALELEREVLLLCRDRQAILKELADSEIELAGALRASEAKRAEEALKLETKRREADARVRAAHEAMLEASRAEDRAEGGVGGGRTCRRCGGGGSAGAGPGPRAAPRLWLVRGHGFG